jgi:hypothetical protein
MKFPLSFSLLLAVGASSISWAAGGPPVESKISTGVGTVQSVFNLPTNPKEGRDPFFPESTRALVEMAPSAAHTVEITALKVPGISGTPGHLLAIINNHTFAVGEEGDVKTTAGLVHIRCLAILNNVVVVEVNGQTHRINVESQ